MGRVYNKVFIFRQNDTPEDRETILAGNRNANLSHRLQSKKRCSSRTKRYGRSTVECYRNRGWNVPIDKAKIYFILPEKLEKSSVKVHTFVGSYGSRMKGNSPVWKNSRELIIYAEKLNPHEGVTVEISFPKGSLGRTGEANIAPDKSERLLKNGILAGLGVFF